MLSYVEFITTPTADTPGTLLLLHFDSRRYLIGNVAEGAQRACIERGIGLRKVSKVLLTGRTEWANLGGLLGLILSLADTKISAASAAAEARPDQPTQKTKDSIKQTSQLDVHGSYNLNHMIATSRRFIFRTGMPINAIEPVRGSTSAVEEPIWQDELIKVWSMAVAPTMSNNARSPLKRTYAEANGHNSGSTSFPDASRDPFLETKKSVVAQMFNSGWKLDNLVSCYEVSYAL
jgi:ribonuclease Z